MAKDYHMIFKSIIIWFSNRLSYDFQIDYHMIFKLIIIWFSNRLSYDFQIDYHMIFKSIIIWFSNQLSYDFQIDYHMIIKSIIIWLSPWRRVICFLGKGHNPAQKHPFRGKIFKEEISAREEILNNTIFGRDFLDRFRKF